MNKLLKYTLVGIASIITILPCFSNAGLVTNEYTKTIYRNQNNYIKFSDYGNPMYLCMANINNCGGSWGVHQTADISTSSLTNIVNTNNNNITPLVCISQGYYFNIIPNSSSCNIKVIGMWSQNYTKAECKSTYGLIEDSECVGMDSMTCQTTYNLIPISEVTPNYCALNFNMISPSDCPINEGTGAIVRSNLMINDVPYAQNQNINVFIPDFLSWNIAFNDFNTTIEVEGYNADTNYIEDVINKEKLTPTNEDFANMLVGLANFFPYLAIAFIMFYIVKLIYKLFK